MLNKFFEYLGDITHKVRGTYLGNNGQELISNLKKVWESKSKKVAINTNFGKRIEGILVNFDSHLFNLENVTMKEGTPLLVFNESYSSSFNSQWDPRISEYGYFGIDIRDVLKSYLIK